MEIPLRKQFDPYILPQRPSDPQSRKFSSSSPCWFKLILSFKMLRCLLSFAYGPPYLTDAIQSFQLSDIAVGTPMDPGPARWRTYEVCVWWTWFTLFRFWRRYHAWCCLCCWFFSNVSFFQLPFFVLVQSIGDDKNWQETCRQGIGKRKARKGCIDECQFQRSPPQQCHDDTKRKNRDSI